MHVQSAYNLLIPLPDPSRGPPATYALVNTLAGSIDVIDREVAQAFDARARHGQVPAPRAGARPHPAPSPVRGLAPDVASYLDRRGYLFASPEEELGQAHLLYEKMRDFHRASVRQPVVVIPTYNCNMHCTYCWQRLHHLNSPIMTEAMTNRFFDVLPDLIDVRDPTRTDLVVFGGEPLQQRPELRERVRQLLTMGRERGFSTTVISNGTDLAAQAFLLQDKVDVIQITLDGPPEVHDRRRRLADGRSPFALAAAGIDAAVAAGIRINIRVNIDDGNLAAMPALARLMGQRGWLDDGLVRPHLAPVKNHNPRVAGYPEDALLDDTLALCGAEPDMAVYDLSGFSGIKYVKGFKESGLLSLHRFFHCEAQINFLAFDLHGDLYPCWDAAGIRELSVGSFAPEVAVDAEKLGAWRERNALDLETCRGCPIAPHCGGGCSFLALEHTGSLDSAFCDAMLAGYVHAITDDATWLIERARAGDHVVGLVEGDRVRTAVRHPFGLLANAAGGTDLTFNCG